MELGLKNRMEWTVTYELTAAVSDPLLPPVFSTPNMINLMELTCAESLKPYYADFGEGSGSVGTIVNIKHTGATPVGQKVYCESELIDIQKGGRKLLFDVKVYDEKGLVGSGTHGRAIINMAAFIESLK